MFRRLGRSTSAYKVPILVVIGLCIILFLLTSRPNKGSKVQLVPRQRNYDPQKLYRHKEAAEHARESPRKKENEKGDKGHVLPPPANNVEKQQVLNVHNNPATASPINALKTRKAVGSNRKSVTAFPKKQDRKQGLINANKPRTYVSVNVDRKKPRVSMHPIPSRTKQVIKSATVKTRTVPPRHAKNNNNLPLKKKVTTQNPSTTVSPKANPKQACVPPQLKANDPAIMKFYHKVDPVVCNKEKDWIYTERGRIFISSEAARQHGKIQCQYEPLFMKSDTETSVMKVIDNMKNGTDLLTDYFKIECTGSNGAKYENIHAGIRNDKAVMKRIKAAKTPYVKGLGFNVFILGFDSLSRMAFMRKLPKAYKYFSQNLKGNVLKGYNIVGDGTPQALIPILTGKTELELPRALRRLSNPVWVDTFPFIWKEYVANGYVTAWSEDHPNVGTFTYRMVGFKTPPTDHYMRPFYVAASPLYDKHKPLCLGHKPRYQVHIDWFKQFFTKYKDFPKFGFGFHNELSHRDNNPVETADDTLTSFLDWLRSEGHMKNTVLILMSDHGARYNDVRETAVGKLEERMPMFGVAFPDDFDTRFPEIYSNFKANLNRLASPFDIYPTLRDMTDFKGEWRKELNPRSTSLFDEIPLNRTCKSAGIENHWCACLGWQTLPTEHKNAKRAAEKLVQNINYILRKHFDLCSELSLSKILRAEILTHEQDMLKFVKTNDADGYRADLTGNTKVSTETYQISFETSPGGGHFEATISKNLKTTEWSANTDDISRTNFYGNAPKCIEKNYQELRKFCYCKKQT